MDQRSAGFLCLATVKLGIMLSERDVVKKARTHACILPVMML